jgi:hypothetical protein
MQLSSTSPAPSASTARTSCRTSRSRASRPPLTVHWYQQNRSPLGPGNRVATTWCGVASGAGTYTRRGSTETTTAWFPYAVDIASIAVVPSHLPPRA